MSTKYAVAAAVVATVLAAQQTEAKSRPLAAMSPKPIKVVSSKFHPTNRDIARRSQVALYRDAEVDRLIEYQSKNCVWDEEMGWSCSSRPTFPPRPPSMCDYEEEGCGGPFLFRDQQEQKFKLGKTLKKAVNVATTPQQLGLLDEDQADWHFDAGIDGQFGKPPNWHVGIGAKWDDEDQEQIMQGDWFQQGLPVPGAHRCSPHGDTVCFGSFDEDQADWQFNAGISGQVGQAPNYNVGISAKWDEEDQEQIACYPGDEACYEMVRPLCLRKTRDGKGCLEFAPSILDDEEQGFGTKLNNVLNTIDQAVNTAHSLGLMDDTEQKIKIGKALRKVTKTAVKASEMGLLEENDQKVIGSKINKIMDKVHKKTMPTRR
jgi:hypothetical protein